MVNSLERQWCSAKGLFCGRCLRGSLFALLVVALVALVTYSSGLHNTYIYQAVIDTASPANIASNSLELQSAYNPSSVDLESSVDNLEDFNNVVTNNTTMVLMLSYQRTGSSFLADVLFNSNQDVFFAYEPLDPLYTAVFGIREGGTVPGDITTFPDGSLRTPSPEEQEAVTWFLEHVLTCDVSSLQTSVFLHEFWPMFSETMSSLTPFVNCMRSVHFPSDALAGCQRYLEELCGERFGQPYIRHDVCFRQLWGSRNSVDDPAALGIPVRSPFHAYQSCIRQFTNGVKTCLPFFQNACFSRPVRAVKTVRATMDSVEPLLKHYPNFRLIHSYRDPRPTVLSRYQASWSNSLYAIDGSYAKIAHAYCQTVVADIRKRRELEVKYPGKIKEVVYRDFVADPAAKLDEVYRFLGVPVSEVYFEIFKTKTNSTVMKTSSEKWRTTLRTEDVKLIERECQTFSEELDFAWDI